MFDDEKIREGVRLLLEGIGEDPDREGLKETPERIARMCREIFGGLEESPQLKEQMQGTGCGDLFGFEKLRNLKLPKIDLPEFSFPQPAFAGMAAGGATTNNTTNNNQKTTNLGGVHITVNGYNARNDDELARVVADKINGMISEDDAVFK